MTSPTKKPVQKKKIEMEYIIASSAHILFEYLTSPSSLSEWFADNVNSKDAPPSKRVENTSIIENSHQKIYSFTWGNSVEHARLVNTSSEGWVHFQWEEDAGTEYFLRFRIMIDEITRDVSLIITDFAEEDEIEETKLYWENKIADLKHALGCV